MMDASSDEGECHMPNEQDVSEQYDPLSDGEEPGVAISGEERDSSADSGGEEQRRWREEVQEARRKALLGAPSCGGRATVKQVQMVTIIMAWNDVTQMKEMNMQTQEQRLMDMLAAHVTAFCVSDGSDASAAPVYQRVWAHAGLDAEERASLVRDQDHKACAASSGRLMFVSLSCVIRSGSAGYQPRQGCQAWRGRPA